MSKKLDLLINVSRVAYENVVARLLRLVSSRRSTHLLRTFTLPTTYLYSLLRIYYLGTTSLYSLTFLFS